MPMPGAHGSGIWLVGDFKALAYQVTVKLNKSTKHSQTTETLMHYTMCYALGVLINRLFYYYSQLLI